MVRTQAQLTDQQLRELRELARQRGASVAALIREGVDLLLARQVEPSREELVQRALSVAGKYSSGLPDLGLNHDKYLEEAYRERKGL
jgi:Arc/MetJ-type ribon-helix-helix transcriptional regulator